MNIVNPFFVNVKFLSFLVSEKLPLIVQTQIFVNVKYRRCNRLVLLNDVVVT